MLNTERTFIATRRIGARLALYVVATGMALGMSGGVCVATAAEVPTLFTAEVSYDEKASNARDDAYSAALAEVLQRVSGSELGRNPAAIADLFPNPSAYVTQLRPGERDTLWVSFDGEAIEEVLRGAGQTVWGGDRPLTLVWLAVDWGQGRREIVAADDSDESEQRSRSIDRNRLLRERMIEIAAERGLPIVFPLMDTTDLQSISFSDIWGGFDDRVRAASTRYGANSILVGRIRPSSAQSNRWTYLFGTEERTWSGAPEAVVGQIADMLAAEFSIGGNARLETVALQVSGIETVDSYGSVQKILGTISLIENVQIEAVNGDTINYAVDVRGGESRLRRALLFAGLIEQERHGGNDPIVDRNGGEKPVAALEFFYNP